MPSAFDTRESTLSSRTTPSQLPRKQSILSHIPRPNLNIRRPEMSRRNVALGVAAVLAWGFATQDQSPVPLKFIPSPTETAAGIFEGTGYVVYKTGNGIGWGFHKLDGAIDSIGKHDKNTSATAPVVTKSIETTIVPVATIAPQVSATTLPAFGKLPQSALPTPSISETSTTLPAISPTETTTRQLGVTAAFTSGDIACDSVVIAIFIANQRGNVEAPVTAMAEASGQPINKLVPDIAKQFWADTQSKLNPGIDLSNPQIDTTFNSPAGCIIPANKLLP